MPGVMGSPHAAPHQEGLMKSRLLILLLTGLVGLAAASPARAQRPVERVLMALEATDRRIEQARQAILTHPDPGARSELGAAEAIAPRARAAFDAGRPRVAMNLTFDARAHADRAIAMARGMPEGDRSAMQLQRTRDLLDRARQRTTGCNDPRAHELLRVAGVMQDQAEAAVAAGRLLAAVELTMGARNRAFRALRLCNVEDDLPGSVEQALRITDEVLARARAAVGPGAGDPVRHAITEAESLEVRAQAEYQAAHYEPSLRMTQAARAMARRAERLASGG
jgi:hypothetical protein